MEIGFSYWTMHPRTCPLLENSRETVKLSFYDPRDIEEFGENVSEDALMKNFVVSSEPEPYIKSIENVVKTGFTQAYAAGSTADELGFLEFLGKHVIPYIKSTYADR
jgi:hypothetical protein